MSDTKKQQQRDELHRAIWAIADELHGMGIWWEHERYLLCMMCYRYFSEKLTDYINAEEAKAGYAC